MKKQGTLFTILAISTAVYSVDSEQEIFEYQPPKFLQAVQPSYPSAALSGEGKEGYVVVNMMVATDGSVYDPIVVESTDSVFESASIAAAEKVQFDPATIDGDSVDGSYFYRFTYQFLGAPTIDPNGSFLRQYRFFDASMEKGDIKAAEKYQQNMEIGANTLYKIAWANLAGFYVARANSQFEKQLNYLKKALAYDVRFKSYSSSERLFLSAEREAEAYSELFRVQIQLSLFAEAVSTFKIIEERDSKRADALRVAFDVIQKRASDETAYAVQGQISTRNEWSIGLHKQEFYIDQVEGELEEIKLHCDAKYVLFAFSEDSQYSIPTSWGQCQLFVIGNPDTRFRLVQLQPHA